jgi:hypothetical protein
MANQTGELVQKGVNATGNIFEQIGKGIAGFFNSTK